MTVRESVEHALRAPRPLGPPPVRATRRSASGADTRQVPLQRWGRIGELGDAQPVGDLVRAPLPRGAGHGVAPDLSSLVGAREQVVEELGRRAGLDQAAQAEPDVPALVAL